MASAAGEELNGADVVHHALPSADHLSVSFCWWGSVAAIQACGNVEPVISGRCGLRAGFKLMDFRAEITYKDAPLRRPLFLATNLAAGRRCGLAPCLEFCDLVL